MGSLSNLYISQSYQSLIHLGTNNTASVNPIELQDGLGNGIGVSVSTNGNLYVSGNIYATNLTGSTINTGSLVTTASFNAYTQSNDSKVNSLIAATASYVTSAITGSSLITASVSQSTITFTKGNGTQFSITIADVSGSAGNFVTTSSFNSYTASQDFLNTTFATTSSVNTLSSSIYQTDATQSFQITANALTASNDLNSYSSSQSTLNNTLSSSIGSVSSSLNTFSSSYKVDSSSFDNRINSLTAVSGGYLTTASFNSYTQSVSQSFETQSFLNGTFATTASVTTLSSSIFQTDSTQSNLINGKLDTSSFTTFSTSVDSRLDSIEFLDTTFATTASVNTLSASIYQTDSTQSNNISALSSSNAFAHSTFATTGSNTFVGNQIVNGAISASGNISASSLYVTDATIINLTTIYETSSVIYSSGSNQFGDSLSDVQILSGSVQIVGGLTLNGANISTQSFVDLGPLNQFTASQYVSNSYFATTSSVDNLSASVFQTDSTQSNQITANSQSAATSFSASNASITSLSSSLSSISGAFATSISASGASVVELSASIYTTDSNQQNQINSLINATSSYAISSSVKVVTDGLQNEINTLSTTASVNSLSASIYQTDSTQSNNIANNSSSIGLLQTFSGSQYKTDSASFDSRIIAAENTGYVTTASFNSYTASQDFKNTTFATTASVNSLSASIYETDSTQSNLINGKLDTSSFNTFSTSVDSRLDGLELSGSGFATTASVNALSASIYQTDATQSNDITNNSSSFATSISASNFNITNNSASVAITINNLSSSIFQTDATQSNDINSLTSKTGSYATTGSNTFNGTQTINGDISSSGNLIVNTLTASAAQITYLHTIFESSSVIYSSGSNQLGDSLSDVQILSGSVQVVGGLTVNGVSVSTQSVDISSLNAFTASQIVSNSYFATTSSVNDLSASLYFTDTTQSNNIASNSSSIGLLQTFSGSQYKNDSSSFDSRIDSLEIASGGFVTTASFNSYTSSQDFKNTTFATTGSNTFVGEQRIYNNQVLRFANQGTFSGDSGSRLSVDSQTGIQFRNFSNNDIIFEQFGTASLNFYNYNSGISITGSSTSIQGVDFIPFSTSVDSRLDTEEFKSTTFATTGSNTFNGNQTISGSNYIQFGGSGANRIYQSNRLTVDGDGGLQLRNNNSGELFIEQYANAQLLIYNRTLNEIQISGSATKIQDVDFIPFSSSLNSRIIAATGSTINTGSFATTGSNTFIGNQTITGEITASGNIFSSGSISASYLKIVDLITVNSIHTNFLSSSNYVSASNIFVANNITANGDISSSTISGLGNATLFSASIDSRINSITVDTSSLVTTASFNAYTQSTNTFTASISTSVGLLQTFSGSEYKADSASFDTRILAAGGAPQVQDEGTILGNATSFNFIGAGVTTSFSAGTASVTIAGGGGAGEVTLGANTFTGSQTISSSLSVVNYQNNGIQTLKILPYLSSSTFNGNRDTIVTTRLASTSGNTSYTASATNPVNVVFGTLNTTISATSIVSGSNNIITNGRAVSTNGAEIQANNSYITVFPSTRTPAYAPIRFTNSNVNSSVTVINSTLGLSSSLALGSYAFGYGIAANVNSSLILGATTLNPNSSSINLNGVVNAGTLTVTGNKTGPDFTPQTGSGFTINNTLNLGTTTLVDLASGSTNFGFTNFNRNLFGGVVTATNTLAATASSFLQNTIAFGSNLIVTGSDNGASANNGGSAFFGRYNLNDGTINNTSNVVFAVGAGTGTGASTRTPLWVGTNQSVNITGSLLVYNSDSNKLSIDANAVVSASKVYIGNQSIGVEFAPSTGSITDSYTRYGKDSFQIYQYQGQQYAFGVICTSDQLNAYTGSQFRWGTVNGTGAIQNYMNMVSASYTGSISGPGTAIPGLDYLKDGQILQLNRGTTFDKNVYIQQGLYVSQSVGGGTPALTLNGTNGSGALVASGSVKITGSFEVNGQTTFASLGSNTFTGNQIVSASIYIASNSDNNQLYLPSGSNRQTGLATLDGGNPGTATISNSNVTANSIIMLTKQTNNHPNAGPVNVSSKGSGTFTITSNHNGDTDVVAFMIINPS